MPEQQEETYKVEIEIEVTTLVSCFDLIDAFGGDFEYERVSDLIGAILKSLVLSSQQDKMVPTYSTTDLIARLKQCLAKTKDAWSTDEPSESDDIKSLIDQQLAEKEEKEEPPPPPLSLPDTSQAEPVPLVDEVKTLTFQELPEGDPLVEEARGENDDVKQAALCFIYSKIPREMWGTPKARDLWQSTILTFKERAHNSLSKPNL